MTGKTIWIVNHYAITPDLAGGTRHYDLGKELVAQGHRVIVFASGFSHDARQYAKVSPLEHFALEEREGVQFVWLRTHPYQRNDWRRVLSMLSFGFCLLSAARRFSRPAVVIGSSPHPVAVLAAWWLALKSEAKFLFEVRDLWPQTLVDMGAMKKTSVIARLLYAWEKFMYRHAAKVIALMPNANTYFEAGGLDPSKVYWLPNGVNIATFSPSMNLDTDSEVGKVFRLYNSKFKVVYTGAHGAANGLDTAIEAAALLATKEPAVQFVLIGDGPEKQRLKTKAASLGCENIVFCDRIPKVQIPVVLGHADVLLQCLAPVEVLKYGGSPNKVSDYLASGRPIVMAALMANDVVSEAQAGVTVPPGDSMALAEGILSIYSMSASERSQLGANGRAYAEKHYDIRGLGLRLAQLL